MDTTQFNGLAAYELGKMMINDFESETSETITAIHEMGHMFKAPDHYSQRVTISQQSQGYSELCLYGYDKEEIETIEDIVICNYCRSIIEQNRGFYSE